MTSATISGSSGPRRRGETPADPDTNESSAKPPNTGQPTRRSGGSGRAGPGNTWRTSWGCCGSRRGSQPRADPARWRRARRRRLGKGRAQGRIIRIPFRPPDAGSRGRGRPGRRRCTWIRPGQRSRWWPGAGGEAGNGIKTHAQTHAHTRTHTCKHPPDTQTNDGVLLVCCCCCCF